MAAKGRQEGLGEEVDLRPNLFGVEGFVGDELVERRLAGEEREEGGVEVAGGGARQAGEVGRWDEVLRRVGCTEAV